MNVPVAVPLLPEIIRLLRLQTSLLTSFRSLFPNLRDWKWMLDSPRSGELETVGEKWAFQKHGVGLRFVSASGVVVDMHREVGRPNVFDQWRLCQFVESLHPGWAPELLKHQIANSLAELVRAGMVVRVNGVGELYQLVT
jgi:hypothetical protein